MIRDAKLKQMQRVTLSAPESPPSLLPSLLILLNERMKLNGTIDAPSKHAPLITLVI